MPKKKSKLLINLNLLKPQSNPEKIHLKLFAWLLSAGRYLFVFVEAVVLIAFIARFKLDADLQAKKEAIEEQIPYIESLRPYETLIRQTQFQLSSIRNLTVDALDWPGILKKIADQTPKSTQITSINMAKNLGNATIHITAQTRVSTDLTSFLTGLKQDSSFSNVNLTSVNVGEGIVKFNLDASARLTGIGEKSI